MSDLDAIFAELAVLIKKHAKGFVLMDTIPNSTAKEKKEHLAIYGKKEVSVWSRKPQRMYVGGIARQKNFVGFYSMALYSHPKEFFLTDPDVKKAKKGKSCINVTKLTPSIKKELERILKESIAIYKREGWI